MEYLHQPVLLEEVLFYLQPKAGQNFIDCTLGGGGHTAAILTKIGPEGKLLGIDWNKESLEMARQRLEPYRKQVTFIWDNFSKLDRIVEAHFGHLKIHGILADLGLSSYLLKKSGRGFSFLKDEPLDMRYNLDSYRLTAGQILNNFKEDKIRQILWTYGEERLAKKIAAEIVRERKKHKFTRTHQLVQLVQKIYTKKPHQKIHPATRTFQALRIFINQELENLKKFLPQAIKVLEKGGKLGIISYHSGEDRIVKEYFKKESKDCLCPPALPVCSCGHKKTIKIITKKPVVPSQKEIQFNPSSRSAKLRVGEKL